MKLSVSLPDEDVAYLDSYAEQEGLPSRSAAVHRAVRLLRSAGLGAEYADAWADWEGSGEGTAWEAVAADGIGAPA
jgi:Arc/MetJ-type ribon-helix-helix transcriptional regulator